MYYKILKFLKWMLKFQLRMLTSSLLGLHWVLIRNLQHKLPRSPNSLRILQVPHRILQVPHRFPLSLVPFHSQYFLSVDPLEVSHGLLRISFLCSLSTIQVTCRNGKFPTREDPVITREVPCKPSCSMPKLGCFLSKDPGS